MVRRLRLDGDGFEIEAMMNVRALQLGMEIAEVPSFGAARIHGTSRLRTLPNGWRVLRACLERLYLRMIPVVYRKEACPCRASPTRPI